MDTMDMTTQSISTNRRGGRPPLLPEERRRHIFQVGFNDSEVQRLEARSEQAGIETIDLIRRLSLNQKINTIPSCNREAMVELNRIGSNVNQIAQKLNAGLKPKTPEHLADWCEKTLAEISAIGLRLTHGNS